MSYLLLSSAKNDGKASRAFNEFSNTDDLATAIIEYFEQYLLAREQAETGRVSFIEDSSLEYKCDDLYQFLDEFFDELCCLVRQDGDPDLYIPYPTDWIKENCIYMHFRSHPEKRAEELDDQNQSTNHAFGSQRMDVDQVR